MMASLLEALTSGMSALVCVKDKEGHYTYANERFIQELGLRDRFEPGLTDRDLFPEEVATLFRCHDAAALRSETPCVDEETVPVDGDDRVYFFNRFQFVDDQGRPSIGVIGFETKQRSKLDRDLLSSRTLFKEILDIAVDAIISIDDEQHIVLFNQGAERIFGYRAEEVVGEPLAVLLPDTARAMHHRQVAHFGESGGRARPMGQRGSITGRRKDGTIFPCEASISRVQMEGRSTYTAILRDITERRQAEEAIQKLNADLKQRAAQLEHANRELEAFSYSVSHDLRAPLRSLDGFSQVLMEDFYAGLPEEAQDSLQRIRAASQRMAQLIDDMLGLSGVTRGAISRAQVDLGAIASMIADELKAAEPERQASFHIGSDLLADADPHLIQVVLTNLLGNAWKYTSKHETARIEFGKSVDEQGRTVFFVKDDGAGFDMAYADKLFGVFQRLHGMTEYAGTGVGLATVQRIIHKHGGEVWAEGAVERGATFYFTLK